MSSLRRDTERRTESYDGRFGESLDNGSSAVRDDFLIAVALLKLGPSDFSRNEYSQEESRLQRRMPPSAVARGAANVGSMPSRGRGRGHHASAAASGLSAFARESVDPIAGKIVHVPKSSYSEPYFTFQSFCLNWAAYVVLALRPCPKSSNCSNKLVDKRQGELSSRPSKLAVVALRLVPHRP